MLFVGCVAGGSDDPRDPDPRRQPLGKADNFGTCEGACGGQSQDGSCWCDDLCEFYGDCCDDFASSCTDEPQQCGGLVPGGPSECPEDEYCHYTDEAMCGAADHPGTCQPKPDACIEIYAPVCGCDGVTYANECYAHAAGTSVASDGACEPDLCLSDDDCDASEVCDMSECLSPECQDGLACPAVCYGACQDEPPVPADSCEGHCGGAAPGGCYCDDLCTTYGDCCGDYEDVCSSDGPCCDPADEPGTNGNPLCFEGATCCADGTWQCNSGIGSPVCDPGPVCGM